MPTGFGPTKQHNPLTRSDKYQGDFVDPALGTDPRSQGYAGGTGNQYGGAGQVYSNEYPNDHRFAQGNNTNTMGHGAGLNDPPAYSSGAGAGAGAGGIPDTTGMNAGVPGKNYGAGHAMTGKAEQVAGAVLGSKPLRAKGMQKEQEAKATKIQSQELAEAERLEREAVNRRERAVAHGAHPANRPLGSG